MNPTTPTPTKPVMDVAAPQAQAASPHNPAPAPAPTYSPDPANQEASQGAGMPVRPAPQAAPSSDDTSPQRTGAAHRPGAKKNQTPAPTPTKPHAPVALITVAIFVMLILSALAVTVYMTSQTA